MFQAVGTATVKTGKAEGFPGGSMVKNPFAMQETLGQEDQLEKG